MCAAMALINCIIFFRTHWHAYTHSHTVWNMLFLHCVVVVSRNKYFLASAFEFELTFFLFYGENNTIHNGNVWIELDFSLQEKSNRYRDNLSLSSLKLSQKTTQTHNEWINKCCFYSSINVFIWLPGHSSRDQVSYEKQRWQP